MQSLCQELHWRKEEISQPLTSIYFGGGTPSILPVRDLKKLFTVIEELFDLEDGAEITLEANPDDLTEEKLQQLRDLPVNRLSIGIQSFFTEDLHFFRRAHTAKEALQCVDRARQFDYEQLTVDLIYGSPSLSDLHWAENLEHIQQMELPHLSAYALTVEPRTLLHHQIQKGKLKPLDEERAARHFEYLQDWAVKNNYEQYEISNFCRPGKYAVHNTAYWQGAPYVGIGPAAHSYDGQAVRRWNVANNAQYIRAMQERISGEGKEKTKLFEKETLSPAQQFNEYIMTGLRTQWGCSLDLIAEPFKQYLLAHIQPFMARKELVVEEESRIVLTKKGRLRADGIAAELFYV